MASGGRLALVPLLAVTIVLSVSGVHGRHTHDPERAVRALAILAPTDDARVAKSELYAFFETGWVGWDVKTAIEIACGTTRDFQDPVVCLNRSRVIVYDHQLREERTFRTYTWLAWSALVPASGVVVLVALLVAARRKRRK